MLRVPFEAGQEAEVSWRGQNGKQRYIGTILKTAKKGMCCKMYFTFERF